METVSIIILTHNAPAYVNTTLSSLKKTKGLNYEVIVVDNDSGPGTKRILLNHQMKGNIQKLLFLDQNTLFAKGNNIGSKLCSPDSKYILLLNSDIKIIDENWLTELVNIHNRAEKGGATAYGVCINEPLRADGYCFLIDKPLYLEHLLDENHEWWWSVTKLQGILLNSHYSVTAIDSHDRFIYHYGGKSGKGFKDAKGLIIDMPVVMSWFKEKPVTIIDFGYKKRISRVQYYFDKIIDRIRN